MNTRMLLICCVISATDSAMLYTATAPIVPVTPFVIWLPFGAPLITMLFVLTERDGVIVALFVAPLPRTYSIFVAEMLTAKTVHPPVMPPISSVVLDGDATPDATRMDPEPDADCVKRRPVNGADAGVIVDSMFAAPPDGFAGMFSAMTKDSCAVSTIGIVADDPVGVQTMP